MKDLIKSEEALVVALHSCLFSSSQASMQVLEGFIWESVDIRESVDISLLCCCFSHGREGMKTAVAV
jgi:hypothetical protein